MATKIICNIKKTFTLFINIFGVFFAGILMLFAFLPFKLFFLPIISLSLLLYFYINSHNIWQNIRHSLLFGIGFFGSSLSWIYVPLHDFGNINTFFAILITIAFILVLSSIIIFFGIIFYNIHRKISIKYHKKKIYIILSIFINFPVFWLLQEFVRSKLAGGFPWLLLAYSQINSPLAGYIPIFGILITSWLTVIIASSIFAILFAYKHKMHITCYFFLLLIIIIISVGQLLRPITWTKKSNNKAIAVSIIQGNIPESLKWQPDMIYHTLNIYKNLTANNWNTLVIWPEAAIPLVADNPLAKYFNTQLSITAKQNNATIITGIITNENDHYYNSAITLAKNYNIYHKRHLVIFGEYLPKFLSNFLHDIFHSLHLELPSMTAGKMIQKNFNIIIANNHVIKAAILICYEIAFTDLLHSNLPQAQVLINISNDAWFGKTYAMWQQLQIAQTMALQTGRYLLIANNNGISAIIDNHGKIIKQSTPYTRSVLHGYFYTYNRNNPYVHLMSLIIILILLSAIIINFILLFIIDTDV